MQEAEADGDGAQDELLLRRRKHAPRLQVALQVAAAHALHTQEQPLPVLGSTQKVDQEGVRELLQQPTLREEVLPVLGRAGTLAVDDLEREWPAVHLPLHQHDLAIPTAPQLGHKLKVGKVQWRGPRHHLSGGTSCIGLLDVLRRPSHGCCQWRRPAVGQD